MKKCFASLVALGCLVQVATPQGLDMPRSFADKEEHGLHPQGTPPSKPVKSLLFGEPIAATNYNALFTRLQALNEGSVNRMRATGAHYLLGLTPERGIPLEFLSTLSIENEGDPKVTERDALDPDGGVLNIRWKDQTRLLSFGWPDDQPYGLMFEGALGGKCLNGPTTNDVEATTEYRFGGYLAMNPYVVLPLWASPGEFAGTLAVGCRVSGNLISSSTAEDVFGDSGDTATMQAQIYGTLNIVTALQVTVGARIYDGSSAGNDDMFVGVTLNRKQ